MHSPKSISILGITGSIGQSTKDVILSARDQFDVSVVTAQNNVSQLAKDAIALGAQIAVIGDESLYSDLQYALSGTGIEVRAGREALRASIPPDTDMTVAAIAGVAGLEPLAHAIAHSKAVAIANKEPLVSAGPIVSELARKHNCRILPIDSEHNAIFQVFDFAHPEGVEKIILTASGGPFRTWSREQMRDVTPSQALVHPTWSMGPKISIDSATMVNKALEVIEAHVLFDLPAEKIEILIHPQSVVHSLVEYKDGSILAQLGASDMRTPIAHALAYPHRMKTPGQTLDFKKLKSLNFELPDFDRFPALSMGYDVLRSGGSAPAVFNAANEEAVGAFLREEIDFLGILGAVEYALSASPAGSVRDIQSVIEIDGLARIKAKEYIKAHPGGAGTTKVYSA